ncbi:MAG: hypothetical protein M1835_001302 [Candelina submexicana]|nr:MAG: hypothetical protein M1835_001302 [Candelina submexicana]
MGLSLASSVVNFCSPLTKFVSTGFTNTTGILSVESTSDSSFNVATSVIAYIQAGAATALDFLQARVPQSAHSYLSKLTNGYFPLPKLTREYIFDHTQTISNQPFEVLACYFLLLIVAAVSMSGWGRPFRGWGGRFSPFTGGSSQFPPHVTDNDFSYITNEDIDTHLPYDPNPPPSRPVDSYDSRIGPDVILLKHRNNIYPLHFPTYSIDDKRLTVGELRDEAAKAAQISDPRRVKLLYKGRILKDDTNTCKAEDLKVNSEILCIISDPLANGEEESDSGEDELGMAQADDGTPAKRKRIRHRKKKSRKSGTTTPDSGSGPNLAPPTSAAGATSRPTTPNLPPAQVVPKTPLEKLAEISSTFHTQFVPQCVQFTNNPPSDPAKRDYEHKKLGEMILAQVLLKLDAVETEGDADARQRRKDLVKETQAVLNSLDAVAKQGTA